MSSTSVNSNVKNNIERFYLWSFFVFRGDCLLRDFLYTISSDDTGGSLVFHSVIL